MHQLDEIDISITALILGLLGKHLKRRATRKHTLRKARISVTAEEYRVPKLSSANSISTGTVVPEPEIEHEFNYVERTATDSPESSQVQDTNEDVSIVNLIEPEKINESPTDPKINQPEHQLTNDQTPASTEVIHNEPILAYPEDTHSDIEEPIMEISDDSSDDEADLAQDGLDVFLYEKNPEVPQQINLQVENGIHYVFESSNSMLSARTTLETELAFISLGTGPSAATSPQPLGELRTLKHRFRVDSSKRTRRSQAKGLPSAAIETLNLERILERWHNDTPDHREFSVSQLQRLSVLLFKSDFGSRNRMRPDRLVATVLVIERLLFSRNLHDLMEDFGRSGPWLSTVYNDAVEYLYLRHRRLLFWDSVRLNPKKLDEFSSAVGIPKIYGFFGANYKEFYRKNSDIQFQALITPDGLVVHLYGPMVGPDKEQQLYENSHFDHVLKANSHVGRPFGGPCYDSYPYVTTESDIPGDSDHQSAMTAIQEHVESGFLSRLFRCNDNSPHRTMGIDSIATRFFVRVLITNCFICLNEQDSTSPVRPPTIEEYLGNINLLNSKVYPYDDIVSTIPSWTAKSQPRWLQNSNRK